MEHEWAEPGKGLGLEPQGRADSWEEGEESSLEGSGVLKRVSGRPVGGSQDSPSEKNLILQNRAGFLSKPYRGLGKHGLRAKKKVESQRSHPGFLSITET